MQKILVVDDMEKTVELLQCLFQSRGYDVITAYNGKEALLKARSEHPNLIISDILMPEMDGFRLCKELKNDKELKKVPFIFYTGTYIKKKDKTLAIRLGADKFLTKPMHIEELFMEVTSLLNDYKTDKLIDNETSSDKGEDINLLYNECIVEKLEKKMEDLEKEILERKRVEAELKKYQEHLESLVRERTSELEESKEKFKAIFYNASIPMALLDKEGQMVITNHAFQKMLNYSEDELRFTHFLKYTDTKDVEKDSALFKELIENKRQSYTMVRRYLKKDTSVIWGCVTVATLCDQKAEEPFALKIVENITEKKLVQKHLNEEKERIQQYLNIAAVMLMAIDTNQNVTLINKKGCEILGYEESEIVGKDWLENFLPESIKDKVGDFFNKLITGRTESVKYYENPILTKSGEERIIAWHNTVLKDDSGKVISILASGEDITDRKKADEELKKSRAMLQSIFDGISDPLLFLTRDNRVLMINRAASEYYRVRTEDYINKHCYKAFMRRTEPCEFCDIPNRISQGEVMVFKRKGIMDPQRIEQVTIYPLEKQKNGAEGAIFRINDITEETLKERQLIQNERLSSIGELAAGVAHEINNPINGIINYAQMLLDNSSNSTERTEIPKRILKESKRIANIVNSLLTFAHESEDIFSITGIHKVINDTLELIKRQLYKDGIALVVDVPENLPLVIININKIQQVFTNILSNARYALNNKFCGYHSEKLIKIEGKAVEIDGKKYIRIIIHDNGEGISPNMLNQICDPFVSTKPTGKGTGLGLSISYGIIKEHNGNLSFESEYGAYTNAIIDIPIINK